MWHMPTSTKTNIALVGSVIHITLTYPFKPNWMNKNNLSVKRLILGKARALDTT